MMKKTILYIMIISVLLSLSGCGFLHLKEKGEAKKYIEKKYGQEPKIIKSKKNHAFTGSGNGLPPTGIKADGTYSFVMEMDGMEFDVCLVQDGSDYQGYDNYEEEVIKENVIDDIKNRLDINCDEVFLSYSELYGKYGENMLHENFDNLKSLYSNDKFAAVIATHDILDRDKIEEYAATYHIGDEVRLFRIEIIQYKDVIPELSFSSFSDTTDSYYVLDWYTISKGTVEHHGDESTDKADYETDEINRKTISEAMGIAEDSRNIKFILAHLNTLSAGKVTDVKFLELDGEEELYFKSEDGINYKMLFNGGSPRAVQNLDTGEWPITSEM